MLRNRKRDNRAWPHAWPTLPRIRQAVTVRGQMMKQAKAQFSHPGPPRTLSTVLELQDVCSEHESQPYSPPIHSGDAVTHPIYPRETRSPEHALHAAELSHFQGAARTPCPSATDHCTYLSSILIHRKEGCGPAPVRGGAVPHGSRFSCSVLQFALSLLQKLRNFPQGNSNPSPLPSPSSFAGPPSRSPYFHSSSADHIPSFGLF
jgi:hypothetical protein